jgi:hypothetical protein
MALVDFSSIPTYPISTTLPSDYGDVSPSGSPNPVLSNYDATWGFFLFEQSVNFQYNSEGTYKSSATFTITGTFTTHASPPAGSPPFTDEQRFNALKDKYNDLVASLDAVYAQDPPADLADYGTINDPRVVPLPDPLRNAASGVVYGRPVSIDVEESRWPEYIRYSAVLQEVSSIGGKATVGGLVVDNGVITINAEKPRFKVQRFPFANSEEIYFGGFDPRVYQLSGVLPSVPAASDLSTADIKQLIQDLMDGQVTIGKKVGNVQTDLWTNLYVSQSSVDIQKTPDGKGTSVSVTAST